MKRSSSTAGFSTGDSKNKISKFTEYHHQVDDAKFTEPKDPAQKDENGAQPQMQGRLYILKQGLQFLVQSLPLKQQQRFPNELLCSLAESLLDGTVFDIINSLIDIQHYTEKVLYNTRLDLIRKHAAQILQIKRSSLSMDEKQKKLLTISEIHKKELLQMDKGIVAKLDEKKRDQQEVLTMAEVPGFEVTDDPNKIKVQMRLIDFILRLKQADSEQ